MQYIINMINVILEKKEKKNPYIWEKMRWWGSKRKLLSLKVFDSYRESNYNLTRLKYTLLSGKLQLAYTLIQA